MKKAKILALILVVSLMVTGAAYALWNQDITLTTSAAMGEMDVELECDSCIIPLSAMPGIGDFYGFTYADMEAYMNPLEGSVASDGQSISVTVGKMYPGAKYGIEFVVKNSGDVPFRLEDVSIAYTDGSGELFSKLTGSFQFLYQKENGVHQLITVPASELTTSGLGAAIVDACSDIVLYPGEQLVGYGEQDGVVTFMQVSVDDGIEGDELENEEVSFEVNFVWQQCNPVRFGE